MDDKTKMSNMDDGTRQAVVGAISAMPGQDRFDAIETHACRRSLVFAKFIARYNELVSAIVASYGYLPTDIGKDVSERAIRFTSTLEEVGECMEEAGSDILGMGQSCYRALEELQKGL